MANRKWDPTRMPDWKIAGEAEKNMKTVFQLAKELQLKDQELIPYGHYIGKLDYDLILKRLKKRPNGKYVDVTAITPTPLGEGKSTTVMGLLQGLGYLTKKAIAAVRQPSSGPTFNIKGSAAGGGLAQCIPLTDFSLGLTGDIDAITNAHNLAMVALTSRMQHEFNYGDGTLGMKKLKRLNIDPRKVSVKWAIDYCAQALRDIIIGQGGKMDGFLMESGFQISVSSELMAILSISRDLKDLRNRVAQMILAYSKGGLPITTRDLEVDGAVTALLVKASKPNLLQTLEGQPVLVHAGPFANIALGQSSIIADLVGLKLADYHITESGFGADVGFEKFWNLKCRYSKLKPDCAVIVTTIRALKMHGGGPRVAPGKPLDHAYLNKNTALVTKGLDNLVAHLETVQKSGVSPVVCINHFSTDHADEVALVESLAKKKGARVAVSHHWALGGKGAAGLAKEVIAACEEKTKFKYLYVESALYKSKIETIAKEIYGAAHISFSPLATRKIEALEKDPKTKKLGVCMAKTHLSLSDNPALKGRPKGWRLFVKDILV
ncbi:MAG: formate--tetrahydrofolate ligase, partial [Cyclobacteriaceae bacterium]